MNANRIESILIATIAMTVVMIIGVSGAQGAPPVKLEPATHISNGLKFPQSVAVGPDGNIYISDPVANRIQELTPSGTFVTMFGREVDKTTKGNICSAVSKDVCQAGVAGTAEGQFDLPYSVSVDQTSGDVYIQELAAGNSRVDKYTAEGQFVWMIGKEVNSTKDGISGAGEAEKNLCAAASGDTCKAGLGSATGSVEHSAFKFEQFRGDLLATGGPEDLLYVADERRVQEFNAEGEWKSEIPSVAIEPGTGCSGPEPGCRIVALAVDPAGHVYLVDKISSSSSPVRIQVFDLTHKEEAGFEIAPRHPGAEAEIEGIALSASGDLAVSSEEFGFGPFGSLYETGTKLGHLLTEIGLAGDSTGIAFDETMGTNAGYMYAALTNGTEVIAYKPLPVAELVPAGFACHAGEEHETDITLACELRGEANPWGVEKTEAWFEYGQTAFFGERSPAKTVPNGETLAPITPPIEVAVRPNEASFFFRLAGYDENVQPPESPLTSEKISFPTPIVAPVIVEDPAPIVSFAKSSSVILFGELNPENAKTEYYFEYGQGEALAQCPNGIRKESCPGVASSIPAGSAAYGKIGTTVEIRGLQPATPYRFRLFAEDESTNKTEKQSKMAHEGEFTTAATPVVQAITGPASAITATSAIVSGFVNPDGQPATYAFELGVYAGVATQYGIVLSGQAGAGTTLLERSLTLTGLQPGTTYAYRISGASGFGTVEGTPLTFTTSGLPAALVVSPPLPMLPTPNTKVPKPPPKCKSGYTRDKQGKCVKTRKAKTRAKRGKKKRK
jgi:hypothetical protein